MPWQPIEEIWVLITFSPTIDLGLDLDLEIDLDLDLDLYLDLDSYLNKLWDMEGTTILLKSCNPVKRDSSANVAVFTSLE